MIGKLVTFLASFGGGWLLVDSVYTVWATDDTKEGVFMLVVSVAIVINSLKD